MKQLFDNFDFLQKENWKNISIQKAIDRTIEEYDIQGAHLQAMQIIDTNIYNELKLLDKTSRNIEIGKMQINNQKLVKQLQELLFIFKKEFIIQNNILLTNLVETTKDSLVLVNKIPQKTNINIEGINIQFICKGKYSSYYKIDNKSLFYDSLTNNIRIKGVNEDIVNNSIFISKYLKSLLLILERNINNQQIDILHKLKGFRQRYINPDDYNIWRSLDNKNMFLYNINNNIIESELFISLENIISSNNYKNYVMPIFSLAI
jgi:DNA polymerase III epsilon subunit-like protein